MILEYVNKAFERATYKQLEDSTWFAEIPGFEGVWANSATVEACRRELVEVLEEWLVLKLRDHDVIPRIASGTTRGAKAVSRRKGREA